jgi:hypothetical protein
MVFVVTLAVSVAALVSPALMRLSSETCRN